MDEEEDGKSVQILECHLESLKLLLTIMKLWGLRLDDKCVCYKILTLGTMTSFYVFTIARWIYLYKYISFLTKIQIALLVLSMVYVLVTFRRINYCRNNITKILETMPHNAILEKSFRKKLLIKIILGISFAAQIVGVELYSTITADMGRKFKIFYFGIDIGEYVITARIMYFLDCLLTVLLLHVPLLIPYIFYTAICSLVVNGLVAYKLLLRDMTAEISESRRKSHSTQVLNLYDLHYEVIRGINDIFSPLLFIWITDMLSKLIFWLYQAICFINLDLGWTLSFFVEAVFCITFFLEITLSASSVPIEAEDIRQELFLLYMHATDDNLKENISKLYVRGVLDPPQFTAWRTVALNRSLVLTVFSLTITYLLIVWSSSKELS